MTNAMSVQGNFQRLIYLQTDLSTAYHYFTDFGHILPRLPEVERVLRYRDGRYRMIFGADDGRGHEMGIVFDIRHELVANAHIKMVSIPVSRQELGGEQFSKSGGPLFPGMFSGEVVFTHTASAIEIMYRINLLVEIEVPRFLSFMPKPVLQKLADSLMQLKLHTVGNGFAERLTEDFKDWDTARNGLATTGAATGPKVIKIPVSAHELN